MENSINSRNGPYGLLIWNLESRNDGLSDFTQARNCIVRAVWQQTHPGICLLQEVPLNLRKMLKDILKEEANMWDAFGAGTEACVAWDKSLFKLLQTYSAKDFISGSNSGARFLVPSTMNAVSLQCGLDLYHSIPGGVEGATLRSQQDVIEALLAQVAIVELKRLGNADRILLASYNGRTLGDGLNSHTQQGLIEATLELLKVISACTELPMLVAGDFKTQVQELHHSYSCLIHENGSASFETARENLTTGSFVIPPHVRNDRKLISTEWAVAVDAHLPHLKRATNEQIYGALRLFQDVVKPVKIFPLPDFRKGRSLDEAENIISSKFCNGKIQTSYPKTTGEVKRNVEIWDANGCRVLREHLQDLNEDSLVNLLGEKKYRRIFEHDPLFTEIIIPNMRLIGKGLDNHPWTTAAEILPFIIRPVNVASDIWQTRIAEEIERNILQRLGNRGMVAGPKLPLRIGEAVSAHGRHLELTLNDFRLVRTGGLNTRHTDVAIFLLNNLARSLKKPELEMDFSDGLESRCFKPQHEALQLMGDHTSGLDHWMLIYWTGKKLLIYDSNRPFTQSAFRAQVERLSVNLKNLLHVDCFSIDKTFPEINTIEVESIYVPQAKLIEETGFYAIAHAKALIEGFNLKKWLFGIEDLRAKLEESFLNKALEDFTMMKSGTNPGPTFSSTLVREWIRDPKVEEWEQVWRGIPTEVGGKLEMIKMTFEDKYSLLTAGEGLSDAVAQVISHLLRQKFLDDAEENNFAGFENPASLKQCERNAQEYKNLRINVADKKEILQILRAENEPDTFFVLVHISPEGDATVFSSFKHMCPQNVKNQIELILGQKKQIQVPMIQQQPPDSCDSLVFSAAIAFEICSGKTRVGNMGKITFDEKNLREWFRKVIFEEEEIFSAPQYGNTVIE